jgi:hypothetical protein
MLLLQLNLISRGIYSKHTQKKFLAGLNLVMVFFFKKKRTHENLVDGFPLKNNNVFDFKFLPLYR